MVDFDAPVWLDMPVPGPATSVRRFLLAISDFFFFTSGSSQYRSHFGHSSSGIKSSLSLTIFNLWTKSEYRSAALLSHNDFICPLNRGAHEH